MEWDYEQRKKRRHSVALEDQRTPFARDRDRILYSSAFRRLAGITQIVRAGEADVFHTRQQHTLKVAQVGRRLAQNIIAKQGDLAARFGVDDEVVEAACLAHDLGHPPFGHIGEHALHNLVIQSGDADGFEGNAQSFRILTKLSVRFDVCSGLDLTRATLGACLKYPWLREPDIEGRNKKWGAYKIDEDDFAFARACFSGTNKTAEAELMDWADDIAYSVHDLEDFHRCGVVPWQRIFDGDHFELLIERAKANWYNAPVDASGRLREAARALKDTLFPLFPRVMTETYDGSREQRRELRTMTSKLIGHYIHAASLQEPDENGNCIKIQQNQHDQIKLLKQVTRDYIIGNPTLVAQQRGQERIIENLFRDIHDEIKRAEGKKLPAFLPVRLRYLWDGQISFARFAADCICSLTEAEAVALHARLQGTSSGSVLDPIVR